MKENQKIVARVILEILGKPKEHVINTMKTLIEQMGKEGGIRIVRHDIKEPRKLEKNPTFVGKKEGEYQAEVTEEFYICFSEIEIELEKMTDMIVLLFKYMPANIEIITPEVVGLTNGGWNDILSELIQKLHGYDEVARVLQVEKSILENKIRALTENVKQLEAKKPKKQNKTKEKKE